MAGIQWGLLAGLGDTYNNAFEQARRRTLEEQQLAAQDEIARLYTTPNTVAGGTNGTTPPAPATKLPVLPTFAQGNIAQYAQAIQAKESGGNYAAVGPTHPKLGRALGAYQVMEANVGPWTREALGREMTPQEFLASPQAQDAVFNHRFGSYVQKTGSPQDAASMWFTGRPLAQGANARDVLGTTGQAYVDAFNKNLARANVPEPQMPQTRMAAAENTADLPAVGAQPAQFVIPGQVASPTGANLPPQVRAMLESPNRFVRQEGIALAQKASEPVAGTVVNGRLVNPRTGALIADYSDTNKPQPWQTFKTDDGRHIAWNPTNPSAPPVVLDKGTGGWRPMSETERQNFGVPANTAAAMGPDGKPSVLPGTPGGPEGEYKKTVSKSYAEDYNSYKELGRNAAQTKNALRLMKNLTDDPNFYSGFGGNIAKSANRALVAMGVKDPNATSPVEAFSGMANEVVLGKLGGKLGAGVSNTDVSFIQQIGPQLAHTPQGNRLLIDLTSRMMDRQEQIADMARDYAQRKGGLDAGWDAELRQFSQRNPLFSAEDVAAAQAATQSAPAPQTLWGSIFGSGSPRKLEKGQALDAGGGITIKRLD